MATELYYVYTHDKELGTAGVSIQVETDFSLVLEHLVDENILAKDIERELDQEGVFHYDDAKWTVAVTFSDVCGLCEKLGNSKPGSTCSMCGRSR